MGAIAKEKSFGARCRGTRGKRGKARTSGERVLPSSTSVPLFLRDQYCGHGAELRVKGGRCGSGARCRVLAGRRARKSARYVQEERSGHLANENVSAEEEEKCAHQSA